MISDIKDKLDPLTTIDGTDFDKKQAGILIYIKQNDQGIPVDLIYTLRSSNMTTHAGEVSFPGGMQVERDLTLAETAIRETHEETNLQPQEIDMLGTFDPLISRHGVLVHPFVATGKFEYQLTPNEEIESIFLVPIDYLMKSQNIVWEDLSRDGKELNVPSWSYNNYKIWGLTAMFTTIFLNRCFNAEIELNFL